MEALRKFRPKMVRCSRVPGIRNASSSVRRWKEFFPLSETYRSISRFFEKAENIVGLAADRLQIGWSDAGSWNAVYDLLPRDNDGNAIVSDAVLHDAFGCYIDAGAFEELVALLGVRIFQWSNTPDALLIADRNRARDVGR